MMSINNIFEVPSDVESCSDPGTEAEAEADGEDSDVMPELVDVQKDGNSSSSDDADESEGDSSDTEDETIVAFIDNAKAVASTSKKHK